MSQLALTCAMCSLQFDPAQHGACQGCPLSSGCSLACCPECGYQMVDIQRSGLARLAARLFSGRKTPLAGGANDLSQVRPGAKAKISGYGPGISPVQQAQLQAYGVLPGRQVRVLQHTPVTIVQVDHTELALETEMAAAVRVEAP